MSGCPAGGVCADGSVALTTSTTATATPRRSAPTSRGRLIDPGPIRVDQAASALSIAPGTVPIIEADAARLPGSAPGFSPHRWAGSSSATSCVFRRFRLAGPPRRPWLERGAVHGALRRTTRSSRATRCALRMERCSRGASARCSSGWPAWPWPWSAPRGAACQASRGTPAGRRRWVLYAARAAGIVLTLRAAAILDIWELAGTRPPRHAPGERGGSATFTRRGPYGWVRHPIYSGWFLVVFAVPAMTDDAARLCRGQQRLSDCRGWCSRNVRSSRAAPQAYASTSGPCGGR